MNKVEQIASVVKDVKYSDGYKLYCYPNIPKKVLAHITTTYDPQINVNYIAAYIEKTKIGSSNVGTIFTITGVYDRQKSKKPFYFNYSDIQSCYIAEGKNSKRVVIRLKTGEEYTIAEEIKPFMYIMNKVIPISSQWGDKLNIRESGEIEKNGLTKNQLLACNTIIHGASAATGGAGAGLAQIPLSDTAIITPIQIGMITALGTVFDIRVTEGVAKGIITSLAASIAGRGLSQVLVGWIPGVGNMINTVTAAGITETIGWAAVAHFAQTNAADKARFGIYGMKAGYEAASDEYEEKLRKQAEEFIKQKKVDKDQEEAYNKLIDDYDEYIRKLEEEKESLKAQNLKLEEENARLKVENAGLKEEITMLQEVNAMLKSNTTIALLNSIDKKLDSMKQQYEELRNLTIVSEEG